MKDMSTRVGRAACVLLSVCVGASFPSIAGAQGSASPAEIEILKDQAMQETEAGQNEAAIRDLQRVLAIAPEWKEGWWSLATVQYAANRFPEAEATLEKVVAFAPKMGTAHALLGLCEFETKAYLLSRRHLDEALSIGIEDSETSTVAAYHLALLLIHGGDFEKALDVLHTNFSGQSNSQQITFAYGLAMLRVGGLFPDQVDPSKEALIQAVGELANAPLERFPALVARYPETRNLHAAYAAALLHAGRKEDALKQLRQEVEVSPFDPDDWVEISHVELSLGHEAESRTALAKARTLGKLHNASDTAAVNPYAAVQRTSSADDRNLWQSAMRAYSSGRYEDAIAELKPLLQLHPQDGTGWAVLGLSEFAQHDYSNALIHLDRGHSLGLNGSAASVRTATYTLSLLLIQSGEFDRASALLAPAARATPQDAEVRFALGLCLLRRAQLPDQLSPNQSALIASAGEIASLLEDSRYDEAFNLFQQLLRRYPSEPFLHYSYGTALLALSRFDEAAAAMQQETTISPKSELPYVRLASIRVRQHQPAQAVPLARQALALAPRSGEAHYLLGRASLDAGDDTTALTELEMAARLSPNSPEVHFSLARAYARAKRTGDAARERETFARLNDLAAIEKSQATDQRYAGPRDTGLTSAAPNP
jgi:tetratricopeptide (TPR) repeat protein